MPRPHDRRCPHLAAPRFESRPVLSSSYRNRLLRGVEVPPPPPPPCDLVAAGTVTPDSTGCYYETGIYNGEPYFTRDDDAWLIWYSPKPEWGTYTWYLTTVLGASPGNYWRKMKTSPQPPTGTYTPTAGASGYIYVTEP